MIGNLPSFVDTLIESLPDPVVCYDEDCHIVGINRRGRESILETYNDLRYLKACDVFNGGIKKGCEECCYFKVKKEKLWQLLDQKMVLPNGQAGVFARHLILWEYNGDSFIIEIWKDLSREQALAREIAKRELFIEGFLELFDIPMFITDEYFRIVGMNRLFEKFVKMPFSHLLGRSLWDIFHGERERKHLSIDRGQKFFLRTSLIRNPEEECNLKYHAIVRNGVFSGTVGFALKRWQINISSGYPHHDMEYFFEICREASHQESLIDFFTFVENLIDRHFGVPGDILIILFNEEEKNFLWIDKIDEKWPLQKQFRALYKGKEYFSLIYSGVCGNFVKGDIANPDNVSSLPSVLLPFATNYPEWFGFPISTHKRVIGYFFMGFSDVIHKIREIMYFFHAFMSQLASHIRQLMLRELETRRGEYLPYSYPDRFGRLIGRSKRMQEVYDLIELVSSSEATVLVTGENGTGKELVALEIHSRSPRAKGPFIVAHCSAYSPTLLESELFGHEKGAFTGAIKQKKGRIERAQGGTLFLDEIGDIAPPTQVLLLRFLQDKKFERVGGEKTLEADVRIIAATNKDLYGEVKAGRFRDDLFYRLNVITIHLPPLRDRKEDIPLLAHHFLEKYSKKENKLITAIDPEAMRVIMEYDWPGNVRQLENAISHAVILAHSGDTIRVSHLPPFLRENFSENRSLSLADHERFLIKKVLEECNWNKHEAARRLNISRSTLYSKIKRYGLA